VEVGRGWLGSLLEAARAHPEAGLFTGTLLFRDEEVVNSTGLELDRLGRAAIATSACLSPASLVSTDRSPE